ncbi:hypothetical protein FMUND_13163 [Fusarium mundagurra]|uniref:Uncharacterized protein n=1 Tax=Fusarium mundagurra TaxID=1567541 RepID=A0A8H5XZQ8_9HYPO|nr:hypothetical protein FMUND_13163 [Fusarium mundagurra]
MAQRVADIDDRVRMPYLISTTQNQFYENYPEQAFRTRRILNRPDPALRVNAQPVGYFCKPRDHTNVLDGTHSQSHGVGQGLSAPFYAHCQPNTYHSYMGEPRVFCGEHEASSVEDMIYYRAKEQRYKNDAERRIQDWTRLMPELVGNSNASSLTHRMLKRCVRNNNKEDKNQSAHKDKKKEKNKGDESKRKRHTFTRRSY